MSAPDPTPPPAKTLGDRVRSLRLGDRQSQRPPRLVYLPWLLVVVLVFVCSLLGYRAYRVSGYDPDAAPAPQAKAAPKAGDVAKVPDDAPARPSSSEEVVLQSKGYVVPVSLIQVSPRVGGQLIEINDKFREGEMFQKGDLIAKIDPKEYALEVAQAEAAFAAAERHYKDLKSNAKEEEEQARAELNELSFNAIQLKLKRDRTMTMARGKAVGQEEMDAAEYGYQAMSARESKAKSNLRMLQGAGGRLQLRVESAEQEMRQAEARLGTAKMRLEWTKITAPVSGIILTKKAELYNLVNPSAFSSGISASLCEMADLTQLEIDLSIQERDIALLSKGQECLIMPEAFQKDKAFLAKHPKGYLGTISRLMPQADRSKGAIPVRVLVKDIAADEAGKYLKPEMGALVSFLNHGEAKAK